MLGDNIRSVQLWGRSQWQRGAVQEVVVVEECRQNSSSTDKEEAKTKNEKIKTSMIYCILCTGYGTRSHILTNHGSMELSVTCANSTTTWQFITVSHIRVKQINRQNIYICKYSVWQIPFPCVSAHLTSQYIVFIFISKYNNIYVGKKKRQVCGVFSCHGHSVWRQNEYSQQMCNFCWDHTSQIFVSRTSDVKNYMHKLS